MDAKYLLGIQEIDAQHSGIFAAMESLQKAAAGILQPQPVAPSLNKLRELLVDHFDYEESFMGSINCPELQEHKQKHAELRRLLETCVSTSSPTSIDDRLSRELGGRISEHLLEYDVKMGKAVESLVAQLRHHEVEEEFSADHRR